MCYKNTDGKQAKTLL